MATDVKAILADGEAFYRNGANIDGVTLPIFEAGLRTTVDTTDNPGYISIDVDLSLGVLGGTIHAGGTASTDNLTLSANSHPTIHAGRLLLTDQVTLMSGGRTFTATPAHILGVTDAITVNFASGTLSSLIGFIPTVTYMQTTAATAFIGFSHNATHKNDSASGIIAFGQFQTINAQPLIQGDTSAITQATQTDFQSRTKFGVTGGGSLAVTSFVQFEAGTSTGSTPTLGTGAAITTRTGFLVSDLSTGTSSTGTVANQIGLDIVALAQGTSTNIGIRNASLTQIANGTAAIPSLSFISDTDTGLYRISANTLGLSTGGTLRVTVDSNGVTLPDAHNVVLGTTTGTKIGTATTQKLGFYNATPVVQPSAYTQTYATADKTHAARTAGSTSATSTSSSPWGYSSQAMADAVVTNLNNLRADANDTAQVLNSLIDDLQALGLIA